MYAVIPSIFGGGKRGEHERSKCVSATEKAHPIAATMERAAGTAAFSGAAISYLDSNTADSDRQPKIADLLCRGQENAVPLRDLCSMTGLDGRTVRRTIERERRAGIPILSSVSGTTGYFLPGNPAEVERFAKSMFSRAREIALTANAVRRCALD